MSLGLTEEQVQLRATVRELAESRIAPVAEALDREERFPYEIVAMLGDLGLMGMTVPERYGGAGLDTLSYALALEELARVDSSVAITVSAHTSLGTGAIVRFGDEAQRERWVPDLAAGRRLAAFGLTEPEAGSDAGACRTRAAEREGGGWTLDGEKMFITNAGTDITACCTVTALSAPGEITLFIVPADAPGYRPGPPLRKIGWHASDTRPLHLDGVRLDPDAQLGARGQGLRHSLTLLDMGRIGVAAIGVGLAQGALELALAHARSRRQFGRAIAAFQAIQFQLAEMATEIEAARCLLHEAARHADAGRPFGKLAAMAKLTAGRLAQTVAERSLHIHGGYGWIEESAIARLYRDAKILEIGEGTSEVQKMVIARAIGAHE
ncbi:MAG: short-chain 2-methylacyl-CoA dehydrogenase [Miltoncostaeaceae bacterium]|jgi:alkylation response protein AidB-like acyl-CoA dehydrogenase|nr:short-chain 2-methylacyl-CoA dehydrogenase [Miltoncostaeaceae bacterium]